MTEQERPRTDWVRDLEKWVSGSDETLANFRWRVNEALEAARTEGRQQAVREIREHFNHARIDRDADVFAILDRVAGLNASESPYDDESRYDDEPFKAWIGTADEMRHDR